MYMHARVQILKRIYLVNATLNILTREYVGEERNVPVILTTPTGMCRGP